jgi:hypothetical protein
LKPGELLDLLFRPEYAKNRYIGAVRAMRIGDLFGDSDGDGDGALGVKFWSGWILCRGMTSARSTYYMKKYFVLE